MESALHRLESGAVLLCLDDESPVRMEDCANIYLNGGRHSGFNRWYDKSIQIMVQRNGKARYMGEHNNTHDDRKQQAAVTNDHKLIKDSPYTNINSVTIIAGN